MLGPQDLWIALALGVFFFGAKKLPELSRSLGQAMSEFKKGVTGTPDEQPPAPPAAPVKAEGAPAKPEGATKEESTG
jgi:TatA/E family protein of Tat protein translocase